MLKNSLLLPGDIILLSNDGVLSFLIKNAQCIQTLDKKPSLWSHCVLVNDEHTIVESTLSVFYNTGKFFIRNGVVYSSINKYKNTSNAVVIRLPLSNVERQRVLTKARILANSHIRYPILGLVGALLSYWVFKWQSNPLQTKQALHCSAFIQECFSVVDVDFDKFYTARNISPELISQYECKGIFKFKLK